jgi:large subunit ribosomal protein L17
MMGNLVASLIATYRSQNKGLVTTEAKAKALRPVAEKLITKAIKGDMHSYRQVIAYIRDEDMAHVLFHEIAPLYEDRPGGYLRILKLGPRPGDKAPMARVQWV